ncbi:MAG: hypothetical protein VX700_05225 [Pseudomonadota bacterium]|nr:hypothetical protein [Pseudomonadota bacterium]MEE2996528.1 hypothetical protein [Pseudomonadota bacterium]
MRLLYTLLFVSFVVFTQPALAGVNKTIAAFNDDIEFVMSKVDKSSVHYQSLAALKVDFKTTADKSWKMARHEFYDFASGIYDKMKKIATDAKVPAPTKPDWL